MPRWVESPFVELHANISALNPVVRYFDDSIQVSAPSLLLHVHSAVEQPCICSVLSIQVGPWPRDSSFSMMQDDLFLFCLLLQIEAGRKFETFIGEYLRHQALFNAGRPRTRVSNNRRDPKICRGETNSERALQLILAGAIVFRL